MPSSKQYAEESDLQDSLVEEKKVDDPLFFVSYKDYDLPGQSADGGCSLYAMFVRAACESDAMDIAVQRKPDWKRDFMAVVMCKDDCRVHEL